MRHEWNNVALGDLFASNGTFFAQNGTLKNVPITKMSRPAKRPEQAREKKDSFTHGRGTSLRHCGLG
jgi:hypothetical protein